MIMAQGNKYQKILIISVSDLIMAKQYCNM